MDDNALVNAVRFYLRQDAHLRRAGYSPLSAQPAVYDDEIWSWAQRAAARYQRLLAQGQSVPVPVEKNKKAGRR